MIRLMFLLAAAASSTMAMARSYHQDPPKTYPSETYFHNPSNDPNAGFYNAAKDPNAVYRGGTYAGSDPNYKSGRHSFASSADGCFNLATREGVLTSLEDHEG
jgi:hypothetical protein